MQTCGSRVLHFGLAHGAFRQQAVQSPQRHLLHGLCLQMLQAVASLLDLAEDARQAAGATDCACEHTCQSNIKCPCAQVFLNGLILPSKGAGVDCINK